MQDGSDAIVRLVRAQRAAHVASGAPWVAVHHGGGVGMGKSIHSGAQILADGTADGALRLERVLTNDPGTGVVRRADAGYDFARRTARERGIDCRCCELAAARPDRPAGVLSTRHRSPTRPSCSATAGWSGPVRPHRQPRAMRCCTWTARASCRFVDSHTHLVFGGDRAEEFQARLAGAPYTAGGIRSTVSATRATSTADLTARAVRLAREACGPVRRRSRSRAGTA